MDNNHISCVHNKALDDGGWILPNGDQCTIISTENKAMQCTIVTNNDPTNITLQRVASFAQKELVYKCCLPNECDDGPTNTGTMIANIYGKLSQSTVSNHTCCACLVVQYPLVL